MLWRTRDGRIARMSLTRRQVTAAALSAAAYRRILGANDRIQVGFIGYGLIGAQHVYDFKNQKDVDMAEVSDDDNVERARSTHAPRSQDELRPARENPADEPQ